MITYLLVIAFSLEITISKLVTRLPFTLILPPVINSLPSRLLATIPWFTKKSSIFSFSSILKVGTPWKTWQISSPVNWDTSPLNRTLLKRSAFSYSSSPCKSVIIHLARVCCAILFSGLARCSFSISSIDGRLLFNSSGRFYHLIFPFCILHCTGFLRQNQDSQLRF